MNPFAKHTLSLLLGIGLGTLGTSVVLNKRIARQNTTIEDLKQDASKRFAATGNSMVTGENWENAQKAIRLQHATIEHLTAQLQQAKDSLKRLAIMSAEDERPESEKPYTVLFDRAPSDPDVRRSQWIVKGRVIPSVVKAPHEAVYYFVDRHAWEGPYRPIIAEPQNKQ